MYVIANALILTIEPRFQPITRTDRATCMTTNDKFLLFSGKQVVSCGCRVVGPHTFSFVCYSIIVSRNGPNDNLSDQCIAAKMVVICATSRYQNIAISIMSSLRHGAYMHKCTPVCTYVAMAWLTAIVHIRIFATARLGYIFTLSGCQYSNEFSRTTPLLFASLAIHFQRLDVQGPSIMSDVRVWPLEYSVELDRANLIIIGCCAISDDVPLAKSFLSRSRAHDYRCCCNSPILYLHGD